MNNTNKTTRKKADQQLMGILKDIEKLHKTNPHDAQLCMHHLLKLHADKIKEVKSRKS